MRSSMFLPALAAVCVAAVLLAGCNGEGFKTLQAPDLGDQPPPGPGNGDGDNGFDDPGGDQPPGNNPFAGTWMTAYGDDRASGATEFGEQQYAVRLDLRQSGSNVSGDGRMFRVFREGAQASDEVAFNVTGTASNGDAIIEFTSPSNGEFQFTPQWYLRLAGNRLVGMHVETNPDGDVVRSGHAVWYRASSGSVEGSYITAYSDRYAGGGADRRSRVGSVSISTSGGQAGGNGGFLELMPGEAPLDLDFDITRGGMQDSALGFTFGGGDLAPDEIDWFAFHTGSVIAGAYGEFNENDALIRAGAAHWYPASSPNPSNLNRTWVTSFGDDGAASGARRTDFIALVTLEVNEGGSVSGNARVLDESAETPRFATYEVTEGEIVGSRVFFELSNNNQSFLWDLRLGGSLMTGAYERLDRNGDYVSRGTAEWRPSTASPTMRGSWAVSYRDTRGERSPETTQLAVVNVGDHTEDGRLSGTGTLRFAGEDRRRSFNVTGSVDEGFIEWVWEGGDLFGDTVWRLRQSSNRLYGSYTNYDSGGNVESRGSGIWLRGSETADAADSQQQAPASGRSQ